jgi:cytochrome c oxidase subunit 2
MRRLLARPFWSGCGIALLSWLAAGCRLEDYPQSGVNPESDYARWLQSLLLDQIFWVVVIFVLVMSLLLVAVFKFRSRPGAPDPKPVHGHTALEIAWTVAPAIVLALVAVPTVSIIYKTQATRPANALVVKAIGHQWWWEFRYPDLGVITATEMHVPVHKPIIVEIETADVIHSFWFPAMGGKRDAVPNHTNMIWFTPEREGTYPGQCYELCGISHANMRMRLFVDTPEAFDSWVALQKSPALQPDSLSLAWQGKQVFSKTSICWTCHTVSGVSQGMTGPNLTHLASRGVIAGATMPNDADHLGRWISNPPANKPGSLMPMLGLPQDQVTAVVAYLQSLK